ncbi:unnamed protein product [Rodentolepis nana]|uniref:Ovule protein n=1 Tax=Rodentolepis nana TaxID=102285 RepID=A0A0R3THA4_RODNA|nr:unnamed protein product [Rodentolepis nana]
MEPTITVPCHKFSPEFRLGFSTNPLLLAIHSNIIATMLSKSYLFLLVLSKVCGVLSTTLTVQSCLSCKKIEVRIESTSNHSNANHFLCLVHSRCPKSGPCLIWAIPVDLSVHQLPPLKRTVLFQ